MYFVFWVAGIVADKLFSVCVSGRFHNYFRPVVLAVQRSAFPDGSVVFAFMAVLADLCGSALINDERFAGNFVISGVLRMVDAVKVSTIVEVIGFFNACPASHCHGTGFDDREALWGVDDPEEGARSTILKQAEPGHCACGQ